MPTKEKTKRDEIREGMRSHLKRLYIRCFGKEPEGIALDYIEHFLKNQEIWLDSMGVVIKTDRELPHYTGDEDYRGLLKSDIYLNAQDHMIKAGYAAFERLIKE